MFKFEEIKATLNFLLARNPRLYAAILSRSARPNLEKIFFLNLLRDGDTILDIGANRGYYTLLFSHIVGGRGEVHAFEPVPATFEKLFGTLRKHGRFENCRLNQMALGETSGKAELYIPGGDDGQVSLKRHSAGSWQDANQVTSVECAVTTLDQYAQVQVKNKIHFIKCDVEGAEFSVLKGGVRTLEKDLPILYLEIFEQWSKDFGYKPVEIVRWLRTRGYQDFYRVDSTIEKLQDPEADVSQISGPSNLMCLVPRLHAVRIKGLVLPSLFEATPGVMLEAMASGLPVVTTKACGMKEVIEDGEDGILVPRRDSHAVAEGVKTLLVDPSLRERMGARAREKARAYTWDRIARQTEALYERLLTSGPNGPALPAGVPCGHGRGSTDG